jgi:hypothetical protein
MSSEKKAKHAILQDRIVGSAVTAAGASPAGAAGLAISEYHTPPLGGNADPGRATSSASAVTPHRDCSHQRWDNACNFYLIVDFHYQQNSLRTGHGSNVKETACRT